METHAKNTTNEVKDKVNSLGDEMLGAQFKEFMVSLQLQILKE